jgi:peptide methionine sulfoxide reductase MsrB
MFFKYWQDYREWILYPDNASFMNKGMYTFSDQEKETNLLQDTYSLKNGWRAFSKNIKNNKIRKFRTPEREEH